MPFEQVFRISVKALTLWAPVIVAIPATFFYYEDWERVVMICYGNGSLLPALGVVLLALILLNHRKARIATLLFLAAFACFLFQGFVLFASLGHRPLSQVPDIVRKSPELLDWFKSLPVPNVPIWLIITTILFYVLAAGFYSYHLAEDGEDETIEGFAEVH